MTDSNLTQVALIEEVTWGTTPATPQMKILRYTGETINFEIDTVQSEEIVTDRQVTDLIQTNARVTGGYNFELSFKEHDEAFAGQFMSAWGLPPEKDNAGTADSVITDAGTTANTYTVASGGTAYVVGMLVRASGFTNAANNQVFRVTTSTATTVVGTALSLTAEAAPPGTARLKVVGFQGASGDITATATGLGSTTLNFTTLGLAVGDYIKLGGTAAGDRFTGTAVNNDWVRVTAVTATTITLDNRPTGWAIDAAAGKTIKVWFGDRLSNAATRRSWTFETGFLGQTTPNYLIYTGVMYSEFTLDIVPARPVSGSFTILGKAAAAATTTPLDSTPTASYTGNVMNAVSHVLRIAEGGVTVTGPNYIQEFTINSSNNFREQTAVGFMGLVGVGIGQFNVTGTLTTYFGDATVYNKIVNGTETSVATIIGRNNQAYVIQLPRVRLSGGTPQATAQNTDVVISADFTALKDTLTSKTVILNRLEYYE